MAENNSNRIMTENSPLANAQKKRVESQVNNAPKHNATRTNSGGFSGAHSTAQQTSQFQTQTTTTQKFSGAHSTAQSSAVGGSSHPINTDYNNPSVGGNTSGQSSVSYGENVSSSRQPQSPLSQSQSTVNQPSTTQSQIQTGTSSSQTVIYHATNEYRTNDASTTVNTQSNSSHGENISSPSRTTSSQSTPIRQSSAISQMSSPKASPTPSYGGGESASATSVTSTAVRNTVQTAKSSAMVLGSAISTTQQMKNAFKSYEGKTVTMDSLKMGASQIMSKVEQSIVTSDDLGSQSVGGIFESVRVGSAIIKASQAVTDAGITVGETVVPKAIQGTATIAKNVGEIAVKGVQGGAIKGTLRGTRAFAPKAWTISKVGIKGGVKGLRGIKGGAVTIATALGGGDNYALQGVSTAIQTADIAGRLGVAGLKTGANATKGITKVGIKTAKTSGKVVRTFWDSYIRTNSIRKAMGSVGAKGLTKVGELLRQAGGSMMSAILSLIKGAGRKLIIPLILIAVVAGGGITIVSAPVMAVGSIFSGIFSLFADDGSSATDWSVENFLVSKVPTLADTTRTTVATEMSADLKANGGSYDIVRLQNMDGSTYNTPDLAGVTDVFYTNEEIVSMIEALFNSLVYMNYELSPTETQANTELNNIYNNIFSYTATPTTEWCGQDLLTGEGTALATCPTVGKIHAIETGANTCPNMTTGTHTTFTDSHCDTNFYTCSGHRGSLNCGKYEHTHSSSCDSLTCGKSEHSHSDSGCTWSLLRGWSCGLSSHNHGSGCYSRTCGCYEHTHSNWSSSSSTGCYSTTYHSNDTTAPNGVAYMSTACGNCTTTMYCIGYAYCNGHGVDTYAFNLDGIYGLLQTTFYDPIEAIESIPEASRTDAQKEQLSTLYDNLEIYNVMTTDVFYGMFGGGMTMADLSGVAWVGGSRTPNQEVVDLALSQVGQVGGQPYWSYYGFGSRVEWCACFVNWCMRNTPSASPAYYTTSNNAYCQTVADYYSSMGQFGHDLSIVTTGDLIFFDWTCDGHTDHIGLVIGRDNEKIYTVEGNSGDQVKVKSYSLSSAVIYGIGYMNY